MQRSLLKSVTRQSIHTIIRSCQVIPGHPGFHEDRNPCQCPWVHPGGVFSDVFSSQTMNLMSSNAMTRHLTTSLRSFLPNPLVNLLTALKTRQPRQLEVLILLPAMRLVAWRGRAEHHSKTPLPDRTSRTHNGEAGAVLKIRQ